MGRPPAGRRARGVLKPGPPARGVALSPPAPAAVVTRTELPFPLVRRGKVRDVYALPAPEGRPGRLLMVATDRISAFDVVLGPGIPNKGACLTRMSNFWFDHLSDVVPNHLVSTRPERDVPELAAFAEQVSARSVVAERLTPIPVECVVRGYLAGGGWKEYQRTGAVCGVPLPAGLREAERLPQTLFTPSSKAEVGHDENISFEEVVRRVGRDTAERLREVSIRLYEKAARYAQARGILIADTKFEFGTRADGTLVLMDEVLTPDSSRFWPADKYAPGASPPSFDKQFLRDWLETQPWDKTPPGPPLPDDVVQGTSKRYVEAFERLTGQPFRA